MLKNRRFWIGLVITLVFLFLFIFEVRDDIGEMGRALGEANYLFLLPGILIYYLGIYFRAVRWRFLLKPLGSFSSIRLFPLIVVGMLVNNVLPARLGIVARAYILGEKENISKMAVGGTMVVEQISDGVILILFAAIISFFIPLEGLLQQVIYITSGLFIGALVLCLVLVFSPRLARAAINVVLRFLPKRLRERTERWLLLLIEGLGIMRSPGQLLIVFMLAALVWLSEAGLFYMLDFAFDLGLPFYVYLLAMSVANLAWVLLMTQGGLGPFDFALQQTLIAFGITVGVASSYTLVLHALILMLTIPLGFVFLWMENLSLSKVIGERQKLTKKQGAMEGDL
ncbi:MAG TPA: lysylphosphatidylglycerol synthase transmembrane domain-containing protein [Dehalococcoidia bacterium]|nr:lysylphosphatidylglycerol synthase transmembrane domain-containing protein [Dehalococcoidia bacterium]